MSKETVTLRALGGSEFVYDLPLPRHMQDKVDRGEMTVVTEEDEPPKKTRKDTLT